MRTRDICCEQWPSFFNDFNQLHQGEHVNVETMQHGGDEALESRLCDLPLVGIVAAPPKSGQDPWIEIVARASPDTHATHSINKPRNVRLGEEENGRAIAVQIDSEDGSITMVRLQPSPENMPEGFTIA